MVGGVIGLKEQGQRLKPNLITAWLTAPLPTTFAPVGLARFISHSLTLLSTPATLVNMSRFLSLPNSWVFRFELAAHEGA